MAESESFSNLERKREESPNNQVDRQRNSICIELPQLANVAETKAEKHDSETHTQIVHLRETTKKITLSLSVPRALRFNGNRLPMVSTARTSTLSEIMKALARAHIIRIGLCGVDNNKLADTIETISRRAKRDDLFDKFVMANVTQKPNLNRIQAELAHALGITMKEKSAAKRADLLRDRIKMEPKILVVLKDICMGINLNEVGIPFGDDHTGCKILLTSSSEEILSNQMHAQEVFRA